MRKIGYNLATRLIVSRIVDTFDLDKPQKKQVQAAISGIHEWHRKSELPVYVQFLDQIMAKTADGLTREEVQWMLKEGEGAYTRMVKKLIPEASALLVTLQPEQVTHAEGDFKKAGKERFERLELPEQDYVNFRLKRAKKNMATWFGSSTDAQLAEFERFIRKNRPEELRRQKVTEESRNVLMSAVRAHADRPALEVILLNWMTKQQAQPTDDNQRAEARNLEDFIDLVVAIDRSLSPQQRQHLLKELQTLRTELFELSTGN